ncbi:Gfo/Idh/MocA family oxidoreductase [Ciceribacter sp. L1K22]|uniref:Gfo/Idh/MocA family protein n=1 Tax=Ciceribacter sp. L1K22 TaxID=2820275 RepID=UPI001ABE35EA|nr:Gfo/Idh/MocA family oxidoreductase [Ciceribacter sp. L1K22]MBO3761560.1 Gfo/Idh/MocA family oxidoreductase [Ciceribacter sp. L1K22]
MIKVGIIGFGKMGQIRADAIEKVPGFLVSKVFDVSYRAPVPYAIARDAHEIVNDPEISAVFVCTPNHLIPSTTIECLLSGKHVFSEKPPAMSASQLVAVKQAQISSGKVLMYGFNHRQHGAVKKMKTLVDSGEYGRILWMRGRYGKSVDANYLNEWRAKKEFSGGGILLDQGIHMLDLFLHIGATSFDEVHAFVSNLYWKLEGIEDNVFAIMRNSKTGLCAQLHSTMTQWRHLFSLEVFLERGYMVLNGIKTGSGSYGEEVLTVAKNRSTAPAATWEDEESFSYDVDMSWVEEAREFTDAILLGNPVRHGNIDDATELMRLIDRIYENDRHEASVLYTSLNN